MSFEIPATSDIGIVTFSHIYKWCGMQNYLLAYLTKGKQVRFKCFFLPTSAEEDNMACTNPFMQWYSDIIPCNVTYWDKDMASFEKWYWYFSYQELLHHLDALYETCGKIWDFLFYKHKNAHTKNIIRNVTKMGLFWPIWISLHMS